jgi:hypothetical protein
VTREELEHAIRAACDVADDEAVYVFGSQAILGQFPDAVADLRQSVEVDIAPCSRLDRVDNLDGSLGELSQFHQTHGFYVHGLPIESATLPKGWKRRLIAVRDAEGTRGKTGWCLEGHDLAASKLAAFREKDRDFVRVLLREEMIGASVLVRRIRTLDIAPEERERLCEWVRLTAQGLKAPRAGGGRGDRGDG